MKNRRKRLEQDYDDALSLRKTIETGKKPRNSNHFLRTSVSCMFQLKGMSREETIDHELQQSITGKEGFFAMVSNKYFSVHEALRFYREKQGVENLFKSMKNKIRLRTIRVWK